MFDVAAPVGVSVVHKTAQPTAVLPISRIGRALTTRYARAALFAALADELKLAAVSALEERLGRVRDSDDPLSSRQGEREDDARCLPPVLAEALEGVSAGSACAAVRSAFSPERVAGQGSGRVVADRPADDAAAEGVEHDSAVDLALAGRVLR